MPVSLPEAWRVARLLDATMNAAADRTMTVATAPIPGDPAPPRGHCPEGCPCRRPR